MKEELNYLSEKISTIEGDIRGYNQSLESISEEFPNAPSVDSIRGYIIDSLKELLMLKNIMIFILSYEEDTNN